MTIQHKLATDPNIHEPKGISTATSNKVYVADGAGSGVWKYTSGALYADMYISLGSVAITLPAASAYLKVNPTAMWTAGASSGLTISPSTGEITLTQAGVYVVDFWVSFDTASIASGTKYFFKYGLDGVLSPRILSVQKNTAGVDRLTCSANGLAVVTAGQKLTINVAGDATSSSTNITIADSGITATLLKAV